MTATKVDLIATRQSQTNNRWCNVQDVQRAAAPRVTRRCLFGTPDQDELQKIWKSNLDNERQRMLNRYGFDVKTEKFVGHNSVTTSQSSPGDKTKNCTGSNRLCNNTNNKKTSSDYKPYKQTCMTGKKYDFISISKKILNFIILYYRFLLHHETAEEQRHRREEKQFETIKQLSIIVF